MTDEITNRVVVWVEAIRLKPAWNWVAAALLGGVSISIVGSPGYEDPRMVFFRLSVPVLIIVVYAWRGYNTLPGKDFPVLRLARVGQLADSVYFLGFLWTLWALIDSFVIHPLSIAEAVFRAFGYALITTASGMFLRLALLQFSYSVGEHAEEGKEEIETQVRRFTSEVDKSVRALRKIQTTLQAVSESFELAGKTMKEKTIALEGVLEEGRKRLDNIVVEIAEENRRSFEPLRATVRESVNRVEEAVNANLIKIGQVESRLTQAADSVGKATSGLTVGLPQEMEKLFKSLSLVSARISNIDVPSDIVEKSIDRQSSRLSQSLDHSTRALQESISKLAASASAARHQMGSNRNSGGAPFRKVRAWFKWMWS